MKLDNSDALEEIRARQRNTVWPDTLRNGRLADAFIWKGSPHATLVQRTGIGLFGLLSLCPAVLLLHFGCFQPGPLLFKAFMLLCAVPFVAIALKLLTNAFRR